MLSNLDNLIVILGPISLLVFAVAWIYALVNRIRRGDVTRFVIACVIGAVAILPVMTLASLMTIRARGNLLRFLDEQNSPFTVQLDGRLVQPTESDSLIAVLRSLRRFQPHHSHPTTPFNFKLVDRNGHEVNLQLGRDSSLPHEYWVFQTDYATTSNNDLGRVVTPLLDDYPGSDSTGATSALAARQPQGSGRSALDNPSFDWIDRDAFHLRIHFLAGSYAAAHQDDLIRRAASARREILEVLGVDHFDPIVDVFFIESRAQMDSLVGLPVTGLADRDARAVFLVTNPEWRAFERHELMHVYAHHVWGPSSGAWIEEGLAQFMDGRCGGYTNDDAVHALAAASAYVPFDTLVTRFRELDDLTAYLQAASIVGYLYQVHGRDATRAVWQRGVEAMPEATGQPPQAFIESWRRWLDKKAKAVAKEELEIIREKGCG